MNPNLTLSAAASWLPCSPAHGLIPIIPAGTGSNQTPVTVFPLIGPGTKRTQVVPSWSLMPYDPVVSPLSRTLNPASRTNPFPHYNGFRQPSSPRPSRPSNSSLTSGTLGGNPSQAPILSLTCSVPSLLRGILPCEKHSLPYWM